LLDREFDMLARALGETLAHLTRNPLAQLLDDRSGLANAGPTPRQPPPSCLCAPRWPPLGAPLTPLDSVAQPLAGGVLQAFTTTSRRRSFSPPAAAPRTRPPAIANHSHDPFGSTTEGLDLASPA